MILTENINQRIPERRLKVRRVDENRQIQQTLETARETGKPSIRATHGGSVANCYGYRADTEGCVTVAFPDGFVWQRIYRLPANKVTLSGVFQTCTGYRGLFDDRFSAARKNLIRKELLNSILYEK